MAAELNKALAKIKIVEARISNVETVLASGSNITANIQSLSSADVIEETLNNYKMQLFEKLKVVRETLLKEGGDIQSIRNERDAAINENVTLKKENERLHYRVRHLIKALNEEENKNTDKS